MLLIIPGLFLLTIWIAVIPAIVLEGRGIGESFGRSHDLVRGNGWNVFGVIILTILLLIAVGLVVGLVLSPAGRLAVEPDPAGREHPRRSARSSSRSGRSSTTG